jgi:hypothetical protein
MLTESSSEEKQRLLLIIEKLLDAEHELGFLSQLEQGDLERLVVAIRGRLGR